MPALEKIHLHSNALLWTPRTWQTIPEEIRALVRSAEISIDAASAETYALNRRGGEFGAVIRNFEFIGGELRCRGPLETLCFSMVVQHNNFREMPDFVRLGKRFRADRTYFSQLLNWGTFTDANIALAPSISPPIPTIRSFWRCFGIRSLMIRSSCLETLRPSAARSPHSFKCAKTTAHSFYSRDFTAAVPRMNLLVEIQRVGILPSLIRGCIARNIRLYSPPAWIKLIG